MKTLNILLLSILLFSLIISNIYLAAYLSSVIILNIIYYKITEEHESKSQPLKINPKYSIVKILDKAGNRLNFLYHIDQVPKFIVILTSKEGYRYKDIYSETELDLFIDDIEECYKVDFDNIILEFYKDKKIQNKTFHEENVLIHTTLDYNLC